MADARSRSPPARQERVRRERVDVARAEPPERRRELRDRPRRIDHVVRDETVLVGDLADDVPTSARSPTGAALSMIASEAFSRLRESPAIFADPRRVATTTGSNSCFWRKWLTNTGAAYRMVDRNVEEPLQLVGMEVHPQHAIRTRRRDQVRP